MILAAAPPGKSVAVPNWQVVGFAPDLSRTARAGIGGKK
jgi:hypothetical protein